MSMMYRPKWPFSHMYGFHDMRHVDFRGLTGSQRTPRDLGRHTFLLILIVYRPCVVIVNMLGQVVVWVELPVQKRLCPIFMSGVGLPDIHDYSAG